MLKKLFSSEVQDICPNCGESCAITAILCPKCGKNLDELFEQLPDSEVIYKPYWLTKALKTANIVKTKYFQFIGLLIFIIATVSIIVHLFPYLDATPAQDVIITVERTMCFGTCPDYHLSIYGDGRVVYEGHYYVRVEGTRTTYIPKRKVRELVDEFDRIGFYEFDDHYIIAATDLPSVLISIDLDGRSKTIDIYGGGAPEEIINLINQIEETVNVARWVGKH